MKVDYKRVVVVIPEDAYKQNAVYRPWNETKPREALTKPERPMIRPQWPSGGN